MLIGAPLISALILLVSTLLASAVEEKPCTIHSGDGKYYDLNPLKSNKDYEIKTSGGRTLYLNVCRPVVKELWSLPDADVGGFIRKDHGDFSVGRSNTTLIMSDNTPKLRLGKGSKCPNSEGEAETDIEFICDTSVFGQGEPKIRYQTPSEDEKACGFFIEWKTHFACPTGERSGPFGFLASLVVLIVVLVMAYLLLGTLYNRYVLQLRGFDQLPRFSLEGMRYHGNEALEWFKEWMQGGYHAGQGQRFGGGGGMGRGGYERVPGGGLEGGFGRPPRRAETNPVSHQAGVDVGSGGGGTGVEGGFVRPQPSSPRPPQNQNPGAQTNPVSHHSQSQSLSQQQPPPPPPTQQSQSQTQPPAQNQTPAQPQTQTSSQAQQPQPTPQETFTLADDEDEEEDLAVPKTPAKKDGEGGGAIRL
ncbi:hypothetical protein V5O48_005668 [Marasmius crinis-equi]|uniref:Autophagy-related protein 27 n=1 Tax=Marasmius crinis-equi TaxID=585013 RepID=A0ABR3FLM3_9AGAR